MGKIVKSVHDKLFVGDTITINHLDCTIDSGMIIGTASNCFRMLTYTYDNSRMNFFAEINSGKGVSVSSEQMKAVTNIERALYSRIGATSTPDIYRYKNALDTKGLVHAYESLNTVGTTIEDSCLIVNDIEYPLSFYTAFTSVSDGGMIVGLSIDDNNKELLNLGLYTDCSFELKLEKEIVRYSGNIVRIQVVDSAFVFYIHPYPMEIIQSSRCGNMTCENGIHPFKFVEFLVNTADSGVTEVAFPESYAAKDEDYIIVGVINNLQVDIQDLVIGSVRIGNVTTSKNFEEEFSKIEGEKTVVWVNVKETSFYKAYEKGKNLLSYACDFISLAIKNDMFTDWYGTDGQKNCVWDVCAHTPNIELDTLFYLENCLTGESITFDDKKKLSPTSIIINEESESLFEKDWIDAFFTKIQECDKKNLRLEYAIKWIVQAWKTDDKYDKLIYCSTALEFIINGETGLNIFDERSLAVRDKKFTDEERKALIDSIIEKAVINDIVGFSEEDLNSLNASIGNMIRNKLTETNFNTKLGNLINRLNIPITEDEKKLLVDLRSTRNKLIHGITMRYITTIDAKKICGITSRILIYKIRATLEGQ
ncbi:hypothetical protein SAMN02910298_01319 [Pseudobutyrivibrio sp. YE44]|uniref:hypothetical protein n=1 Tax=Pseudobutyrivibrio sp. YE44 TaxID=1520802 RepID=UPI000888759B|nr:hypothetical protein [Pseudobutyrivibrio sp. YE44]SDB26011.1 hypothetical protein SAMN02910298_01319 [Pseudobutyrivibrio sp. YE44]